jgi:hypothetical protein
MYPDEKDYLRDILNELKKLNTNMETLNNQLETTGKSTNKNLSDIRRLIADKISKK